MNRLIAPVFHALLILALIGGCATQHAGQSNVEDADSLRTDTAVYPPDRPVPNPINGEVPPAFHRAVEQGTRTHSGEPGPRYWSQRSDYEIDVQLHPGSRTLAGTTTITYHNNSPDTLGVLALELAQNVHAEGVIRNESAEVTGGMTIDSVSVEGQAADRNGLYYQALRNGESVYSIDGTLMTLRPRSPVLPGTTVEMHLTWRMEIPQSGAGGRMGFSQDNLFFLAYWYPKMRVYDDVIGWFTDPFRINAEFYHDFGSYRVNITAPPQWIVAATGTLANPRQVLQPRIHSRLQRAHSSDSVMEVVGREDFGNVTVTPADSAVTWTFHADSVRDFAFSATRDSRWDATRAPLGDRDGDGQTDYTAINTFYRSSAPLWENSARFSRHSIDYLSRFTGLPYPWEHMTAVEGGGIIGGGMEFPMMTVIGSYNGQPASSLYAVIAHEVAHMWVPMTVSTNERRYSWLDEGTTTFNEDNAKTEYYPDTDWKLGTYHSYLTIAGTGDEGPIMRWSDFHYLGAAYGVASYPKPASMLFTLRNMLGEETFNEAYRTFLQRWKYKHPYPWDLFNTFEDVTGRDLDWFWRSWFYETWVLDQAVSAVSTLEDGTTGITIEDHGRVPMPATVRITFAGGATETHAIPVEHWLEDNVRYRFTVTRNREVVSVEIDPERLYPDANRANNRWERAQ
ncbi:MAG: M1 family metallopeptidase [Balneolaceae bacterium]|nr:M1 family metallopeptidase [Balneolaceae bacterium]